jgi:UDP-N-acetylglucosamine enolpyruvyl transferase
MDRIRIVGGRRLEGTIPISGAKNATLPLMIASLLTDQPLVLDNVPRLADVGLLQRILGNHGVDVLSRASSPANRRTMARPCRSRRRGSSIPPRPTSSSPRCARASG